MSADAASVPPAPTPAPTPTPTRTFRSPLPPPDRLQRYLAVRRWVEAAACIAFLAGEAALNAVVQSMDLARAGAHFEAWKIVTWEVSSNVMWLALLPLVVAAVDRWPLRWGLIARHLPWHAATSLLCSALHVAGMVALRKLAYATQGQHYDFGDWPRETFYEALKDVRAYVMIVAVVLGYRLLLWRWQGEARWLSAPDGAPNPAPGEAPAVSPHSTPRSTPDMTQNTTPAIAPDAAPVAKPDRPERFLVKKLGREFLLPTAEIEWVQACGNYVNLHRQQHDYPLRATLAAIEKTLDPARFVRVHRSYLVNLARVEAIEPTESGDARLRMKDGASVPCSRTHLETLRARAARPLAGL